MAARISSMSLQTHLSKRQIYVAIVLLPLMLVTLHSSLSSGKKIDSEAVPKFDELVITVEHALTKDFTTKDEDFKPRGTITLRSLKHQTGSLYQRDQLTKEDLQILKDMAQNGGYYRIRVPSQFGSNENQIYVSTFVKACALYESKLTEMIRISVDHLGYIYGVGLTLPVSECEGKAFKPGFSGMSGYFNTTVQVLHQVNGALPDTLTYVQRLDKEKAEQAAGKGKDNRSFLAKYWMYIVPVVIFMLMTSQQSEQQGGEGGS